MTRKENDLNQGRCPGNEQPELHLDRWNPVSRKGRVSMRSVMPILLLIVAGCKSEDDASRREMTVEEASTEDMELPPKVTTAQRMGLQAQETQDVPHTEHDTGPPQPAAESADQDPHAELPVSQDPHAGVDLSGDPHTGMDIGQVSAGSATDAVPVGAKGFRWDAPAHWVRGPDKSMRLVTYAIGDSECYIVSLGGDGGGLTANVNRWYQQLMQPTPSDAEFGALPRLKVLGQEAVFAEVHGVDPSAAGGDEKRRMLLGVVCPLEDQTLFIKMIGQEDQVAAEVDHFKAFCQSLVR